MRERERGRKKGEKKREIGIKRARVRRKREGER